MRHLDIPVLIVRGSEVQPPAPSEQDGRQILVPLDGSPLAEEALGAAARFARMWQSEITLVQVVVPLLLPTDDPLAIPLANDQDLTETRRRQAQEYLNGISEQLRDQGLRAPGVAVVGWSAAGSILDVARPHEVSLVVLATHGRGGLRRIALGSVADKVVRAADVPVLVVRASGGAKPTSRPPQQPQARRRAARRPRRKAASA